MKSSSSSTALRQTVAATVALALVNACSAGPGGASGTRASTTLAPTTPAPTVAPADPSTGPSATTLAMVWTPTSLENDWPASVRPEPVGDAIDPQVTALEYGELYPDAGGDIGSALPWIDIRNVTGSTSKVVIDLAENMPPLVAPIERWIAYGVVVDTDRDGEADLRFGIDNIPATAPGKNQHRAWMTDLHTGVTVSAVGAPYGQVGKRYFDTFYPGEWNETTGASLGFGGDTTAGVDPSRGIHSPFYAWASLIEHGHVVATDYAPDTGWLEPAPIESQP